MILAIPEAQRGAAVAGLAAQVGIDPAQLQALVAGVAAQGGLPPPGQGTGGGGHGGGQVVQLTPAEGAALKRIQEMGFTQQQALEAYLACDKDEALAINYLLNGAGFQ